MNKLKSILQNVTLSAAAIIVFFLVLEISVRAVYYYRTGEGYYLYWGRTNAEFILSRYFAGILKSKDDGETEKDKSYIIAALGGSTVYGWFVPRDKTWPYLLEQKLNEAAGRHAFSVINCGQGGSDSTSDIARIKDFLASGRADMIIYYAGINDSVMRGVKKGRAYYTLDYMNTPFLERLNGMLMKFSLFYTVLHEKLTGRAILKKKTGKIKGSSDGDGVEELTEYSALRFKQNILSLNELCKNMNIKLVLGTVPAIKAPPFYSVILDETRAMARQSRMRLIDVNAIFDSLPAAERDSMFVEDGVHLNERGTAFVAGFFAKELQNLLDPR